MNTGHVSGPHPHAAAALNEQSEEYVHLLLNSWSSPDDFYCSKLIAQHLHYPHAVTPDTFLFLRLIAFLLCVFLSFPQAGNNVGLADTHAYTNDFSRDGNDPITTLSYTLNY